MYKHRFYNVEVYPETAYNENNDIIVKKFKVSYGGFGIIHDDDIYTSYKEKLLNAYNMCNELNLTLNEVKNK